MKYNIPEQYKPFMASVKRQCKTYGVELMLSPSKQVVLTDDFEQECSGYFEGEEKVLVVACGKHLDEWMQILVHEFCHMEQWKSDDRWDKWNVACSKLWGWLDGSVIMNKTQLSKVIDDMVELEKDCEMRAVEKIKKWELPINVQDYVQKANTYLYSYAVIPYIKRFPTGIYYDRELVEMMPTGFRKSYRKPPEDVINYIIKNYSKI